MRRTNPLALLLLLILSGLARPAARAAEAPICEIYAAGHFGNWYEVAGVNEMRRVLAEAKAWGFNRYGDWFDAIDCVDLFSGDPQYSLANALWDLKRTHFQTAQSLGLATDLVITPNHVYRDQLKPEWLAKRGPRIQGQLICPHQPGAVRQVDGSPQVVPRHEDQEAARAHPIHQRCLHVRLPARIGFW